MTTFDLLITKSYSIRVTIEAETEEEAIDYYYDNEADGEYADKWNDAEIYCDPDIQVEESTDEEE